MKLLDVVKTKVDIDETIKKDMTGTIVEILDDGVFEVDFYLNNEFLDNCAIEEKDLELFWEFKIFER